MQKAKITDFFRRWWVFLVLFIGSSWLYAPFLNRNLSDTTTLISQYEAIGQPYAWLFRLCDVVAALLIGSAIYYVYRRGQMKIVLVAPLLIFSIGSFLDGVLAVSCHVQSQTCAIPVGATSIAHGAETVITAFSLFAAVAIHYYYTKKKSSLYFLIFQIAYAALEVITFATHTVGHRAISQYLFQLTTLIWVVATLREYIAPTAKISHARSVIATLVFINGLATVALSVIHLPIFRVFEGLYFANTSAWLAQHTLLVGVSLIYLSRHIYRGEVNARRLVLVVLAIEIIKYSLLTPQPYLILVYSLSFVSLYIAKDSFDRHSVIGRPRQRVIESLQALLVMGTVLGATIAIAAYFDHIGKLPARIDQYLDFAFRFRPAQRIPLLNGVLLVHLINAGIVAIPALLLISLFRPARFYGGSSDMERLHAAEILSTLSTSSEDFFKIWPEDKTYFWNAAQTGFIAYKVVGGIAFALADPIVAKNKKAQLAKEFMTYCRSKGWRSAFLLIGEKSVPLYEKLGYAQFTIGASALIQISTFSEQTSRDKWWRWQNNRSLKAGLSHHVSDAPHAPQLIDECKSVSDIWLKRPGRHEQSFALGYFDTDYLQKCRLHYLVDANNEIVAFTNEIPIFSGERTSIDLLRFKPNVDGAMPALLSGALHFWHQEMKFTEFDLGFVPLAKQDSSLAKFAKMLAGKRFSAEGLAQFKNKFDPRWEQNYLAIDGDLADLAAAALNLDRAMTPKVTLNE